MGILGNVLGAFSNQPMPPPGMPARGSVPPANNGPKPLDLRNGAYHDPSMFRGNFHYRVEKDLRGTLKSAAARSAVADVFHQKSRAGNGITKGEVKHGLNRLVAQGQLTEDQMWAVRKKYGAF